MCVFTHTVRVMVGEVVVIGAGNMVEWGLVQMMGWAWP